MGLADVQELGLVAMGIAPCPVKPKINLPQSFFTITPFESLGYINVTLMMICFCFLGQN